MYTHSLKKAGHDVEIIANGAEALEAARQNVYDIILLDLMLPLTKIIVTTNFDEPAEDRT